jgi:hypothetical protein
MSPPRAATASAASFATAPTWTPPHTALVPPPRPGCRPLPTYAPRHRPSSVLTPTITLLSIAGHNAPLHCWYATSLKKLKLYLQGLKCMPLRAQVRLLSFESSSGLRVEDSSEYPHKSYCRNKLAVLYSYDNKSSVHVKHIVIKIKLML